MTAGRHAFSREVKLLAEPLRTIEADGVFEGYASLFGVADLGRDVVMPGAFADSLRRRGAGGIRMLWQHDPAEPVGRWLSVTEDARGLRVRGRLNLAVERAREIHALLREGAVDGLSIGFRVLRARPERATGLRHLEALDLWDLPRDLSDAARRPRERGEAAGSAAHAASPRRRRSRRRHPALREPPVPRSPPLKARIP